MVAVEGRLFRKWFPAAPNLLYYFVWDKADVYSQKVYGLSEAFGKASSVYYMEFMYINFYPEHLWFTNANVILASFSSICGI